VSTTTVTIELDDVEVKNLRKWHDHYINSTFYADHQDLDARLVAVKVVEGLPKKTPEVGDWVRFTFKQGGESLFKRQISYVGDHFYVTRKVRYLDDRPLATDPEYDEIHQLHDIVETVVVS
jgi:hypothetical protein